MSIKIDYEKCCWKDGKCTNCECGEACEACVEACPVSALKRTDKLEIDEEKCLDCGICIGVCKHGALSY